jgi:hypothetical protein
VPQKAGGIEAAISLQAENGFIKVELWLKTAVADCGCKTSKAEIR